MQPFSGLQSIPYEGGKIMEERNYAADAFEKYSDMVYRLAFARVKNRTDADDILQEVFLRYLRRGEKADSEEHERALLIRITINCTKSLHTGAWRRHTTELDDRLPAAQAPSGETLDAVLRLPLKYRTVIHLHYYGGYTVEEIAILLKSRPSTVKSQLFRAREKLKQDLKGVEF